MGSVLVTGGAGYIGSHTVRQLAAAGEQVVVVDNLSTGLRRSLPEGIPFIEGDIGEPGVLTRLFRSHRPAAIVHLAASTSVSESVADPLAYYRNNVSGPLTLLETALAHDCRHFVFSSTCAVYGTPTRIPVTEDEPLRPINPYGAGKAMWETILRDSDPALGLRSVSLRYFNACGCALDGSAGEERTNAGHLLPCVLRVAAGENHALTVHGSDYKTPDGTCVRDYTHVDDLARAHVAALAYLRAGGPTTACNLGTGRGVSVLEMVETAREVTGHPIPVEEGARRQGDAEALVADAARARTVLGWEAAHDVRTAIETHWRWLRRDRA